MKSLHPVHPATLLAATLLGFLTTSGCGQKNQVAEVTTEAQPASFHQDSAQQYLQAVLARYQNAAAYLGLP